MLSTITEHIAKNCERLNHEEFGKLVRADNLQDTWKKHSTELKEVCTSPSRFAFECVIE